jgi:hypothetical protein
MNICGKIENIKDEQNCFTTIIVKTNKTSDTLNMCNCSINDGIRKYIAIGDSIIKRKGYSKLTVVHNKYQRKQFEYPCCDQ